MKEIWNDKLDVMMRVKENQLSDHLKSILCLCVAPVGGGVVICFCSSVKVSTDLSSAGTASVETNSPGRLPPVPRCLLAENGEWIVHNQLYLYSKCFPWRHIIHQCVRLSAAYMSVVTPAWWSLFYCRYTWFRWVLAVRSRIQFWVQKWTNVFVTVVCFGACRHLTCWRVKTKELRSPALLYSDGFLLVWVEKLHFIPIHMYLQIKDCNPTVLGFVFFVCFWFFWENSPRLTVYSCKSGKLHLVAAKIYNSHTCWVSELLYIVFAVKFYGGINSFFFFQTLLVPFLFAHCHIAQIFNQILFI